MVLIDFGLQVVCMQGLQGFGFAFGNRFGDGVCVRWFWR